MLIFATNPLPFIYILGKSRVPQGVALVCGNEILHENEVKLLKGMLHLSENEARDVIYPYQSATNDEKILAFAFHTIIELAFTLCIATLFERFIPTDSSLKGLLSLITVAALECLKKIAFTFYALNQIQKKRVIHTHAV